MYALLHRSKNTVSQLLTTFWRKCVPNVRQQLPNLTRCCPHVVQTIPKCLLKFNKCERVDKSEFDCRHQLALPTFAKYSNIMWPKDCQPMLESYFLHLHPSCSPEDRIEGFRPGSLVVQQELEGVRSNFPVQHLRCAHVGHLRFDGEIGYFSGQPANLHFSTTNSCQLEVEACKRYYSQ